MTSLTINNNVTAPTNSHPFYFQCEEQTFLADTTGRIQGPNLYFSHTAAIPPSLPLSPSSVLNPLKPSIIPRFPIFRSLFFFVLMISVLCWQGSVYLPSLLYAPSYRLRYLFFLPLLFLVMAGSPILFIYLFI